MTGFVHRRSARKVAVCGTPARQDQLADADVEVTCPSCRRLIGVAQA